MNYFGDIMVNFRIFNIPLLVVIDSINTNRGACCAPFGPSVSAIDGPDFKQTLPALVTPEIAQYRPASSYENLYPGLVLVLAARAFVMESIKSIQVLALYVWSFLFPMEPTCLPHVLDNTPSAGQINFSSKVDSSP